MVFLFFFSVCVCECVFVCSARPGLRAQSSSMGLLSSWASSAPSSSSPAPIRLFSRFPAWGNTIMTVTHIFTRSNRVLPVTEGFDEKTATTFMSVQKMSSWIILA